MLSAHPKTLLRTRGSNKTRVLLTQKDPFELDHPGVGKQETGIVSGDQGGTLYQLVPVTLEIIKKASSNFGSREHYALRKSGIKGKRVEFRPQGGPGQGRIMGQG
jgi:hypothetical protein